MPQAIHKPERLLGGLSPNPPERMMSHAAAATSQQSFILHYEKSAIEKTVKRYPDAPDIVLPEAGALEHTSSYREKKAMPLVKKLVKWMHSPFRKKVALTAKCDMLKRS